MPEGASRILEIEESQRTPRQKAAIEALLAGRGRMLTPYKIWLHSPALFEAMEKLGTFLNKGGSLAEREVELGITLIAKHWGGQYVYNAHIKMSLDAGQKREVMQAIKENRDPPFETERERAIYLLANAAAAPGAGSDETFDFALRTLGRDGVAEAIALFGYYSAVAIGMKLHRVPPPPDGLG